MNVLLLEAAKNGDAPAVAELLAAGADQNAPGAAGTPDEGFAALHLAAWNGALAATEILVRRADTDVNLRGKSGNTPLHLAAREGHVAVVRSLLALGPRIEPDPANDGGFTPLMLAARSGWPEVVSELLNQGERVDPRARERRGSSSLDLACNAAEISQRLPGKLAALAVLLSHFPDLADVRPGTPGPFEIACRTGFADAVVHMLANGVGVTPLGFIAACAQGHTDLVLEQMLPRAVAFDVNDRDRDGRTGFAMAVRSGHLELASYLFGVVDATIPDEEGNTPFHHACTGGQEAMLQVFLGNTGRFDPAARNRAGFTGPDLVADVVRREQLKRELRLRESAYFGKKLDDPTEIDCPVEARILGRGGQGEAAVGQFRGQAVAVKRERTDLHDPNWRPLDPAVFDREIRMWTAIGDHENILPLLAWSDSPCRAACPLAAGDMLHFLWDRKRDANYWEVGLSILADVAKGLRYCHAQSVVHGDLKNSNVLVFDEGGRPVAKLADFGGARLRFDRTLSGIELNVGTWIFIPPESYDRHTQNIVRRPRKPGDVYAFAMLCYQAASRGFEPFDHEVRKLKQAPSGILRRILDPAVDLRPAVPAGCGAPPALVRLMRRCWDRDPAARPTFDQIVPEIQAIRP